MKIFNTTSKLFGKALDLVFAKVILRGSRRTRVALVYDEQVLLVQDKFSSGKWKLPGGGIKKGESAKACASRELNEELGLTIQPNNFTKVTELQPTQLQPFTKIILKVNLQHKPELSINHELSQAEWFTLGDLPSDIDEVIQASTKLL